MTFFKVPRLVKWIFPFRTWDIKAKNNIVYLTFDDGPQPAITDWVIDFLGKEQIVATFFCVGNNLHLYPEYIEKLTELGHKIGNHTMRHEKGIKTSYSDYLKSVHECQSIISSKLFRPPYGRMTLRQSWTLKRNFRIVMWSWLSHDFDSRIPIPEILESVDKIKSGDILVFHDNVKSAERLRELLPEIIYRIKAKGFSFQVLPD